MQPIHHCVCYILRPLADPRPPERSEVYCDDRVSVGLSVRKLISEITRQETQFSLAGKFPPNNLVAFNA